ncbi:hypothetical protein D046_1908B, partial [Vibrio parahaemolyticus V-223/04]
NA